MKKLGTIVELQEKLTYLENMLRKFRQSQTNAGAIKMIYRFARFIFRLNLECFDMCSSISVQQRFTYEGVTWPRRNHSQVGGNRSIINSLEMYSLQFEGAQSQWR